MVTVYDTTELYRTGPRKFHAAWAEINGYKVSVPPTVARELAPNGMPGDGRPKRQLRRTHAGRGRKCGPNALPDTTAPA